MAIWQVVGGQPELFPKFPPQLATGRLPPYLPVYEHPHLLTCHGRMFTHTQLHGILIVMFCHVISQDSKLAIQLQAEIAIFYARRLVPRGKSTFRPRGEFIFGFFGIQRWIYILNVWYPEVSLRLDLYHLENQCSECFRPLSDLPSMWECFQCSMWRIRSWQRRQINVWAFVGNRWILIGLLEPQTHFVIVIVNVAGSAGHANDVQGVRHWKTLRPWHLPRHGQSNLHRHWPHLHEVGLFHKTVPDCIFIITHVYHLALLSWH